MDILYPGKILKFDDINNNSIVCKFIYKDIKILFTGDIESKAEEDILKRYDAKILKSDVLKIAHHGSRTSTSDEFLKAVSPKIALIGVRKKQYFWASKRIYNRKIKKSKNSNLQDR